MTQRWERLMDAAQSRWDRLSVDDVRGVRGNAERLLSVLQVRYGLGRDEALREVQAWRDSLRAAAV
jgi:hypothetical protein